MGRSGRYLLVVDSMSRKTKAFVDSLASTIKELRVEAGITRSELAARSGLSAPFIGYIEEGERCPSVDTLKRISLALGISATEIISRAEKRID